MIERQWHRTLLAILLLLPLAAMANDALWDLLRKGGYVVLIRHAQTTPGVGDPQGFRLDDCATQRNLSEEGRTQARRLGLAFRANNVPIDRVISSPWCRCIETATLAFGKSDASHALGNLFGRPENAVRQTQALTALIEGHRGRGNLVLVSHGSTIGAATGTYPSMSEMVIAQPNNAGRFVVIGRLLEP